MMAECTKCKQDTGNTLQIDEYGAIYCMACADAMEPIKLSVYGPIDYDDENSHELHPLGARETLKSQAAELVTLRDLLNRAYAECDNARDGLVLVQAALEDRTAELHAAKRDLAFALEKADAWKQSRSEWHAAYWTEYYKNAPDGLTPLSAQAWQPCQCFSCRKEREARSKAEPAAKLTPSEND